MPNEGKYVWSGDLPDGSHVEFREDGGKLLKFDRVFNQKTGRSEPGLVRDKDFSDTTSGLVYRLLQKLSKVEGQYTASLWESDERR